MKKFNLFLFFTLIVFIAIGYYNQAVGQSIEKLDEKNGFKNFKFGSPPDTLKSKKVKSWTQNPNITTYQYIGTDFVELYNAEIEDIQLEYFKNKLINILVPFKLPFLESDYKIVLYSLQQVFGPGGSCSISDPEYSNVSGRKWIGTKVEMEIFNFFNSSNSMWSGYLSITNKSLLRQSLNDEF